MHDAPHLGTALGEAGTAPDDPRARRQAAARIVLAIGLALLGLYILEGFLRALLWALVLGVATWPLYRRVEARMPRDRHNVVLPALFTLAATLLFVVPLALAVVQLGHEVRNVGHWVAETRAHGAPLPDALAHLPFGQAQVSAWWQANLADPDAAGDLLGRLDRAQLMETGRTLGSQILHRGVQFAFTLLALFFIYRDGRVLRSQMLTAADRLFGPQGEKVGRQVVASVHGTVDGLVLVGLGTGIVLGIGYVVAGVPHPVLMGAVTAVGAMFPLGGMVALSLACLLLLAAGKAVPAIAVLAGGSAVIFAADHFIRPALIGGATRLPFLWVLLGILGGVETFGLLGLFLGPAVMAALIMLWREWVGGGNGSATHPPGTRPEHPA